MHVGMTWSGWDLSLYALNVGNNLPMLYNNALNIFTFYGATFTLQPRTLGVTAMYHW
jgi:hypothetical protein